MAEIMVGRGRRIGEHAGFFTPFRKKSERKTQNQSSFWLGGETSVIGKERGKISGRKNGEDARRQEEGYYRTERGRKKTVGKSGRSRRSRPDTIKEEGGDPGVVKSIQTGLTRREPKNTTA